MRKINLIFIFIISIFIFGCSNKIYQLKPFSEKPLNEKIKEGKFSFIGSSDDVSFGEYHQINIAKKNAFIEMNETLSNEYNTTSQFIGYASRDRKEYFWIENDNAFYGIILNENNFLNLLKEYNLNIKRR